MLEIPENDHHKHELHAFYSMTLPHVIAEREVQQQQLDEQWHFGYKQPNFVSHDMA